MKNKVILTSYTHNLKSGAKKSVYHVEHSSKIARTTLEQNVTIEMDQYGRRTIDVGLEDFPQGLSDRETMLKLADWLHRLSVSIENHWGEP